MPEDFSLQKKSIQSTDITTRGFTWGCEEIMLLYVVHVFPCIAFTPPKSKHGTQKDVPSQRGVFSGSMVSLQGSVISIPGIPRAALQCLHVS